ncbi:DEAD/DEAH box helicase [Pseudorhodoferax sp. Leaf267]|jgi:superfamily II DNA or RNA helicase|uniref:DEAD/DEAH box helicase n=1 Tax=Pseudorhodoferax sp. Leaf267 TaxID=1736316 RepID=UPI0006F6F331|nr:DEAD/DEAH box helicase [Pseudorhodoferax sp. Leaf267]KQP14869.1 helicase [Pseudorhodoferax sp. Leaf267]
MSFEDINPVALAPVRLRPPELLVKAVADGRRVGLQLLHIPGVKKPLAAAGGWWCAPRRMSVLRAQGADTIVSALRSVYHGHHVDLEEVPGTIAAALRDLQADYFSQLLDVQIFPLRGSELSRGRYAVSFLYDGPCVAAMRSLNGLFHTHAAAWQVQADPEQIIERLQGVAGVSREFVFVHEHPVLIEQLSSSSSGHVPISVPAMAPERGVQRPDAPEDGTGYFSTELDRVTDLGFDSDALNGLVASGTLRDYQAVGVRHLLGQTGSCLGDDMGLGKSRQVVVSTRMIAGSGRVLIVCPATLRMNWLREIQLVYPQAVVGIVGEAAHETLQSCEWVVANYERLGGLVRDVALGFAVMAVDEAHYLKEYDSGRTRNMFLLAARIPRRYVVTGTPLLSREVEMHTLLRMTGHDLGNLTLKEFAKEYAGTSEKRARLASALKGWMLRRSKDVLTELGEKSRQVVHISPPEGLGAYQEIWNDTSLPAMSKIVKLRQTLEALKIGFLVEMVEGLSAGDKLIIFCEYIPTVDALSEALQAIGVRCVTLVGKDSLKARQRAIDAFQQDDGVTVFIGTTSAAGVGITLTAANYVAFASLPWTPALMRQAEDRAYRLGQRRNVVVKVPLVPKTIDAQVWEVLQSKRETEVEVVEAVRSSLLEPQA